MVASMTAYGRRAIQQDWGQAIWEVRSVNHRYLDLSFKIPDNLRQWESDWRHLATQFLQRGKVECNLLFMPSVQTAPQLQINQDLVKQLIHNCQVIAEFPGIDPSIKAIDLLQWPQVLMTVAKELSALKAPLTELFSQTLEDISETRRREGNQLRKILQSKLAQVLTQVDLIQEEQPLCLLAQRQKLEQKFTEIQISLDPERLEQEFVFHAQRMDVEEEIQRLITHATEVKRILGENGTMGRRLDFLMQEMNREANTLAAKAGDSIISKAAVELKVLIEQMREQIQNVE